LFHIKEEDWVNHGYWKDERDEAWSWYLEAWSWYPEASSDCVGCNLHLTWSFFFSSLDACCVGCLFGIFFLM